MTELLEHPEVLLAEPDTIEKVSIVISKGSLEDLPEPDHGQRRSWRGSRPTSSSPFRSRRDPEGPLREDQGGSGRNRACTCRRADRRDSGLAIVTKMMKRQMEKIDIPPIPEFIEINRRLRAHACTPARRRSTCSA